MPRFGDSEIKALMDVVRSERFDDSADAKFGQALKARLCERLGTEYALLASIVQRL